MSCFKGQMREYTSVSLDRFDGRNISSTIFCLSHCHKDHMVGLDAPVFEERLKSRTDLYLYCSDLTRTLLLADHHYRHLEKFIKVLEVDVPTMVTIPDKEGDVRKSCTVLVTALSAGHCPGSVMFLFEGKEGTVLYTGDFRWETNYAQDLQAFKSGNSVKEIKSLYIDTTFCFEDAFHFPGRNECVDAASDLISKWLNHSKHHVVSLSCKAKYGYEHFLHEIRVRTGEKIHTSQDKCTVYQQIKELKDVFTTDPAARIHVCNFTSDRSPLSRLPCGYLPDDQKELQVLVLRPSTMFFALQRPQHRSSDLIVYPKGSRGLHRVCYSFHSSYVEVRDLVMFLKPQRVFPNVKPPNECDMSKVQARLNSFLNMVHLSEIPSRLAPSQVLGQLKVRRRICTGSSQSDSEGLVFGTPEKTRSSKPLPRNVTPTPTVADPDKEEVESMEKATPAKSETSNADSSYQGSVGQDEELDLFSSQDSRHSHSATGEGKQDEGDSQESYCLYVSGDEECEEEDRVSTQLYPDNDDIIVIDSQDSEEVKGRDDTGKPKDESLDILEKEEIISENRPPDESKCGDTKPCISENKSEVSIDEVTEKDESVACSERKQKVVSLENKEPAASVTDRYGAAMSGAVAGETSASAVTITDSLSLGDSQTRNDKTMCDSSGKVGPLGKQSSIEHASDSKSMDIADDGAISSQSESVKCKSVSKSSFSMSQKDPTKFRKTPSFDLFDEGHVTDIEDNVTEDIAETQGFDVDMDSDSGQSQNRRRKYITEIDKDEEKSLRESTAQMLLRLQTGAPNPKPPDPEEQIVISDSDSDSDTESGFLSGSKETARVKPSGAFRSVPGREYARNLGALVSKVEKRLASSDGEFSPSKRLRLDISRNCESDSDVTLPPSQGSHGSRLQSCLFYDSSDSDSEIDTDSDAVEILYETDASGAKFDVLGNPMRPETSVVRVQVQTFGQTTVTNMESGDTHFIDLTEDGEEDEGGGDFAGEAKNKGDASNHNVTVKGDCKKPMVERQRDEGEGKKNKEDGQDCKAQGEGQSVECKEQESKDEEDKGQGRKAQGEGQSVESKEQRSKDEKDKGQGHRGEGEGQIVECKEQKSKDEEDKGQGRKTQGEGQSVESKEQRSKDEEDKGQGHRGEGEGQSVECKEQKSKDEEDKGQGCTGEGEGLTGEVEEQKGV